MSNNRIVGPTGQPIGGDGKQRSPTMEERLQAALEFWRTNQKDMAFATALNAIAYQSSGLSGLAKLVKKSDATIDELRKRIEQLEGNGNV